MTPASRPPERRDGVRLLAVDTEREGFFDSGVDELPQLLSSGDVVVVNDAATLPASLFGVAAGQPVEVRIAGRSPTHWSVVLFGRGDWHSPTEDRPAPPVLSPGATIALGGGLTATVLGASTVSSRLLRVQFDLSGADLWAAIYTSGAPVQYSYQQRPLDLWSVQTVYGSQPWAVEMPSAGRPLAWSTLLALRRRGVILASLTHAAGLSATGDPALDSALPLPERYHVPRRTVDIINRARKRGGRIIAVGTSVVRALEGNVREHGHLVPGEHVTDLIIDASFQARVADGILTGMHNQDESHYKLLGAFSGRDTLTASWRHAVETGYLCHEFGDVSLLMPNISRPKHRRWISTSATDSKVRPMVASSRRSPRRDSKLLLQTSAA